MAGESLAEIAGLAVAHAPGGFGHAAAGLQVAQGQRHARAGVKVLRTAAPGLAEAAAQAAFAHVQLVGQAADGNAFMRVRQQPAAGLLHAGGLLRTQQARAFGWGRGGQGRGAAGGQQAQLLDVLLGAAAVAALALGVDEAGDGDAAVVKAKLLAALLFKRRVALQPEGQAQQRARQAAAAFVLLSGLKAQCDCVGVLSVCPAARAL